MTAQLPVVKGTLDTLVLKALAWEPMHGFEITTWLERASGGELGFDDSALYQALYRMEARKLVKAEWGVTENNRQARYYSITQPGRTFLKEQTASWVRYSEIVTNILTAPAR